MNFLGKMERKFGKYAIRNLTVYIIATYIIAYFLQFLGRAGLPVLGYLTLDPGLILRGQVWRLISWVLIPPDSFNLITLIILFTYYQLGSVLEKTWGAFLYNVYIFFGLIMTVIGAFILYAFMGDAYTILGYGSQFSTYYVSLSIFLGFALTYPDMQMLLYFFIPIKIKYLAVIDVVYLLYSVVTGNWAGRVVIICSLMNVIVFFLLTRNYSRINPREIHRKKNFKKAVSRGQVNNGGAKHKCAVCGRTEKDDPNLEFRFCSKCKGNYEYCQDHLFTHEHVK
ncbi:hypothetical protein INP51_03470 [Blautia liquoris]|uniref:Peptidase S54 rhomboid domain-containing protein n=1 Tax=Blautia liquoris TaxID=2779518 RepID=A0A7M2RKD2_9FIRM|nr:hypothetical protein [Blautia liquoris]QOV20027.1 hypothetical protein INP51_03470 [Blautia liquoris]